jgi:exportin-T
LDLSHFVSHNQYSGVHHPLPNVRRRVFYLFFRFVQSLRIDIEIAHVPSILQAIQDLLTVEVEFPSDFEPPSPPPSHVPQENDFLSQILQLPCVFDSQLHMFEAAGALVSSLWSQPEIQANALHTLMNPMLAKLSECLTVPLTGSVESEGDAVTILTVHHTIRALGSVPKGFPEYPNPIPDDYIQPPLAEFRQMAEAILVSMDVMGRHKVVREAVSCWLCTQGDD